MVLLIDANIILDVLMNRKAFVKESSLIWKMCETEQVKGYISTLTFANIVYIMRKELSPDIIEEVFRKMGLIFEFVGLGSSTIKKATEMRWDDFEDAIQSATAEDIKADFIITRNVQDYMKSKVKAVTPAEFWAEPMITLMCELNAGIRSADEEGWISEDDFNMHFRNKRNDNK